MKTFLTMLCLLGLSLFSLNAAAQQSQDFGDYVVHFNAFNDFANSNVVLSRFGIGHG